MKINLFVTGVILLLVYCPFNNGVSQVPVAYLTPIDTIYTDDSTIVNFKIIDYNGDNYPDYYLSTNSSEYIIDGSSDSLLWRGPETSVIKFGELFYIQSLEIWRNYVLENPVVEVCILKWYDLPDTIPADSISLDYQRCLPYEFTSALELDIGYIPEFEYLFIQAPNATLSGTDCLQTKRIDIIDLNSDSTITSFITGSRILNATLTFSNEFYFINAGSYTRFYWPPEPPTNHGVISVLDDSFSPLANFPFGTRFLYSADLLSDSVDSTVLLLTSSPNNMELYDNILSDPDYVEIDLPMEFSLARFLSYNNCNNILYCNIFSHFEILNMDLSFNSFVITDLPVSVAEFLTEDINGDGTDEIFCVYENMVIVCEFQNTVGVNIPEISLPHFSLENYPNPFNAQTTIEFNLPIPGNVCLSIFDLLGRKVCILIDDYYSSGKHSVVFEASNLSSGVYFYRLQAGEQGETKRMIILK